MVMVLLIMIVNCDSCNVNPQNGIHVDYGNDYDYIAMVTSILIMMVNVLII